MKKIYWVVILFLCLIPFFIPGAVNAQEDRWYQYNRISTLIRVNRDTSFDVAETQKYLFHGTYHQGDRDIPFKKIDTITDIRVVDESTHTPLTYSPSKLTKTDPSSWGKYTTYRQNNEQFIEWYYNATDESHEWTLYYKVIGGISFLSDADRLNWNLFTNYQVPVLSSDVTVELPGTVPLEGKAVAYQSAGKSIIPGAVNGPNNSVVFRANNFDPGEPFTVDVSWPKGFIDRGAYWRLFVFAYYGYIGAVLLLLISVIVGFIYWLVTEKLPQDRLTVVPEYKPPKNLRPAIAEVVVKETLTPKGMAATVVDLAVRGYLKIEEQPGGWASASSVIGLVASFIVIGLIVFAFFIPLLSGEGISLTMRNIFYVAIFSFVLIEIVFIAGKSMFTTPKNYQVTLENDMSGSTVEDYERNYIDALMQGEQSFTTDDLKKSTDRSLYYTIQKIKDDIYKRAKTETKAFAVDPIAEKMKWGIWFGMLYGVFAVGVFTGGFGSQLFTLVTAFIASMIGLVVFIRFEARLNAQGMILKDEWLGFKMFLETAEKGEMQHVTPDLFPKYLPYAMIFGVENKWAHAFQGMSMPAQTWYVGGGGYSSGGSALSSSGSSFGGFSASFSSSFSSAFASSAGGGGGGGGGGCGGGWGGGGGGAS